jgi:hypothetical protein
LDDIESQSVKLLSIESEHLYPLFAAGSEEGQYRMRVGRKKERKALGKFQTNKRPHGVS